MAADTGSPSRLFSIAFGPARLHFALTEDFKPMKHRCFFLARLAVVAFFAAAALVACSHSGQQPPRNLKLMSAAAAFSQALIKKGQAIPSAVPAKEVISDGYLTFDDVGGFDGINVMIWLQVPDTEPQSVLMTAQLPGGIVNAMLADGSTEQFSPDGFQAHLQKTGQQAGAANPSQPVVPQTNGTSSAAGSRR